MKKLFSHGSMLNVVLFILILTLLVSCTNEAGALTQNTPDQSAIPQKLVGQWENIDSSTEQDFFGIGEVNEIEILGDGMVLYYVNIPYSGDQVVVLELKILTGDRLLFYSAEGAGDVFSFTLDENELKLSRGEDSYLYRRKISN